MAHRSHKPLVNRLDAWRGLLAQALGGRSVLAGFPPGAMTLMRGWCAVRIILAGFLVAWVLG